MSLALTGNMNRKIRRATKEKTVRPYAIRMMRKFAWKVIKWTS